MSNFFAASLGACLGIGLLLLLPQVRAPARFQRVELDVRRLCRGLLYYLAVQVFPDLLFGHGDPSYGLIHVGFPVNPRPHLRELAAGWRPGPLEVFGWVWLIGFVLCMLGQVASLLRFWRRVDKESHPASERVQQALMDASRALEDGVLSEKAYEDGAREVVVMPTLSGPVSLVLGVRLLLLDREDYDDQTLDAILRHELVHVYGRNTSMRRLAWFVLGALFWFVPTMWLLRREARVREEYTCDREANLGRTMEERRAYAHAMASLAAPRRREAFGTANMACGEATLRRRVEALFRAEPALRWWQKALRRLLAFAVPICVLLVSLMLFSGPAHYAIDEGNLLNFVGHDILFELSEGMHRTASPPCGARIISSTAWRQRRRPTAAAVYNEMGDIYLSFPDAPAAATRPARNWPRGWMGFSARARMPERPRSSSRTPPCASCWNCRRTRPFRVGKPSARGAARPPRPSNSSASGAARPRARPPSPSPAWTPKTARWSRFCGTEAERKGETP